MSAEDATNYIIVTVSVGLLLELEFYVANTDEQSDTKSKMSQWGNAKYALMKCHQSKQISTVL